MSELSKCQRCEAPYHPHKSTSSLRLTFCNRLCEVAEIGFDMMLWLRMEPVKQEPDTQIPMPVPPEPVAV